MVFYTGKKMRNALRELHLTARMRLFNNYSHRSVLFILDRYRLNGGKETTGECDFY